MSADPLEGRERARQEFEKWIREQIAGGMHGWNLTRDRDGYHLGVVHSCWVGWQARGRENARLLAVLRKIEEGDGDHFCDCEHDTEDCCAKVDYFCPHCIAGVALRGGNFDASS